MKITIERSGKKGPKQVVFNYKSPTQDNSPTALDILLQAQESEIFDLAYRYGCRNGLCGVCTVMLNNRPKLACRCKVKSGDVLSPLQGLPVIKDLVVKRNEVNQQLLGKLPTIEVKTLHADDKNKAMHSLNRCIECYACLPSCTTHRKNLTFAPYQYGNPYSFLRIQQIMVDANAQEKDKQQALALAESLGIQDYDEKKVPPCGVGINLKNEVILPLKQASVAAQAVNQKTNHSIHQTVNQPISHTINTQGDT